jgi:hypothetical protein
LSAFRSLTPRSNHTASPPNHSAVSPPVSPPHHSPSAVSPAAVLLPASPTAAAGTEQQHQLFVKTTAMTPPLSSSPKSAVGGIRSIENMIHGLHG